MMMVGKEMVACAACSSMSFVRQRRAAFATREDLEIRDRPTLQKESRFPGPACIAEDALLFCLTPQ